MIASVTKQPISLVKLAHTLVKETVNSGDIVIDATVGNGHDTRFLLDLVKPNGNVFGFDIQHSAIDSTLKKIADPSSIAILTLMNACHTTIFNNLPSEHHGKINAVMYNLGYLPGSDKQIITRAESTLVALSTSCTLLANGGIITILAYPGHEGGELETAKIKEWCLTLDPGCFEVNLLECHNNKPLAPKLFVIRKISYDDEQF